MKSIFKKICIGSANFNLKYGHKNKKLNIKSVNKIMDYSWSKGITNIDTAMSYDGTHKILGNFESKNLKFITKLSLPSKKITSIKDWCIDEVIKSRKVLKTKCIYGLLIHDSKILENKKQAKDIYEALDYLKKKKIIYKTGLSIYDPLELDKYFNEYNFQIVQFPFNIFDRRILNSGWLKKLSKNKIELHARSIFLQGLLLYKSNKIPKKFIKWKKYFFRLNQFVDKKKISNKQACISFVKKYNQIDKFVIGANDYTQIRENLEIFKDKTIKIPLNLEVKSIKLINPKMW
tara:strand:+ start:18228 stop:19097 length:870 start_codon:yes stop_codon:yes gene_type:complete